jgi:hypothetical protein
MPFPGPMHYEQLKEVHTPEEMRAEIHRISRSRASILARTVMDCADFNGLSAEDRYTMLAYHALRELVRHQQISHDLLMVMPRPDIVLKPREQQSPPL